MEATSIGKNNLLQQMSMDTKYGFYVSPNRKSYRQGPPDQLWINSLRNGMTTSPGKHGCSPDRPKVIKRK